MDVSSILRTWNCAEEIIQKFQDNEIDHEAFVLLDVDEIRSLIPQARPRVKFMKNFRAYIVEGTDFYLNEEKTLRHVSQDDNSLLFANVEEETNLLKEINNDENSPPGKKIKILHVENLQNCNEYVFESKGDFIESSGESQLLKSTTVQTTQSDPPTYTARPSCSLAEIVQSRNTNSKVVVQKRITAPIAKENLRIENDFHRREVPLFPEDLKAHLARNVNGKIVLKSGENLNKDSRQILVRCLVDYLFKNFSNKYVIPKEIFIEAAKEIVLAYPNEQDAIYFVPGKPKTKTTPRTLHQGKLRSLYNNLKAKLGPFTETVETDETDDAEAGQTSDEESSTSQTTKRDLLAALQYLKSNIGVPEEQLQNWSLCRPERAAFLDSHSIHEYIQTFPVLRTQFGYNLFLQDFDYLYPERTNSLYAVWEVLSRAIIRIGISKGHLYESLLENSNENLIIKYMPLLFSPGTLRNNKTKTNFRPSNQELEEAFFLHVFDTTDLDNEINRRRELVLQRGDTLQPFVIGVGSEVEKLTSIYIYVDGTKYLMESSLKAVDVCFKSIQVLDANYPSTVQRLWTFIQRYIYKIHTVYDDISSSHAEVAVDLCISEPDLKDFLWDGKTLSKTKNRK